MSAMGGNRTLARSAGERLRCALKPDSILFDSLIGVPARLIGRLCGPRPSLEAVSHSPRQQDVRVFVGNIPSARRSIMWCWGGHAKPMARRPPIRDAFRTQFRKGHYEAVRPFDALQCRVRTIVKCRPPTRRGDGVATEIDYHFRRNCNWRNRRRAAANK